jgi:hypothetical protein
MKSVKSKNRHFTFTARLQETMYGNFTYAAAFLPKKIVDALPAARQRTSGTINDIPFLLAIQYRKDGRSFFLFSRSLCKKAGVGVGSPVTISFELVDSDWLELPEELEAVLAQDDEARKIWDSFTRGRQRSLTIYVTSVKGVDSRIKRSLELANKVKWGQLHVQINQNKRKT